jgi:hypothetical protein
VEKKSPCSGLERQDFSMPQQPIIGLLYEIGGVLRWNEPRQIAVQ